MNLLNMYRTFVVGVVVIDYEKGLLRKYVDAYFIREVQRGEFDSIIVIRIGITPQGWKETTSETISEYNF